MSGGPSTIEEAVELFIAARRRGESGDPEAFAARHPWLGPELAEALAALAALEATTHERDDDALPDRIGAYRIVREVGRGGMGVVLEAVEEPLNRRIALKVLPPELLASASARARFRREAELAARLDHSGIATVYGAGVEAHRPWIAMRYIEGETLTRRIAAARAGGERSLGSREFSQRARALSVAATIAKVARALHYAHEHGVVHRDVKPSNIVHAPDGTPVLLDFGLAIAPESDEHSLTRTGETAGTPAYLAPELVSGERSRPDAQSDVFSLGVTLFECLTLRRPFDAPTPAALYRAIASDAVPDVRASNRDVPRDLAVVVSTALDRERSRRYASAAALADDLEACADGRPIAARPVPVYGRIWRWARREPKQAVLGSLLALATIAAAALGGTWLASRDVVRAAESVARQKERDRVLVEGYSNVLAQRPADAAFARALELDPQNLEALAGRAFERIGKFRYAEAAELLRPAPNTPGFDAMRAFCARQPVTQDQVLASNAAAPALDCFLVGVSLHLEAHHVVVSRQEALYRRSLAMLDEAVIRSPRALPFFYVPRAIVANAVGDKRAARSAAGALLALWPDSFHELVTAGAVLLEIDPAEAQRALERADRLDPTHPEPSHELGTLARNRGDAEACEAYMWRALARGELAEIHNTLGISYAMRGCFDEAADAWTRALVIDPRHHHALLNMAQVRMQRNDLRGAIDMLERMIRYDPTSGVAFGYLGATNRLLGNAEAARDCLVHSVALDDRRPDFWHELASLEQLLGESEAALDVIDVALARHPRYEPLRGMRSQLVGTK